MRKWKTEGPWQQRGAFGTTLEIGTARAPSHGSARLRGVRAVPAGPDPAGAGGYFLW